MDTVRLTCWSMQGAWDGSGVGADLQDVEELEGLHLEAEAGINQQQHQVRVLGSVYHAVQVLRAHSVNM